MLNSQKKQEAHKPLTYVAVVIMALPFVGLIAVLADHDLRNDEVRLVLASNLDALSSPRRRN